MRDQDNFISGLMDTVASRNNWYGQDGKWRGTFEGLRGISLWLETMAKGV